MILKIRPHSENAGAALIALISRIMEDMPTEFIKGSRSGNRPSIGGLGQNSDPELIFFTPSIQRDVSMIFAHALGYIRRQQFKEGPYKDGFTFIKPTAGDRASVAKWQVTNQAMMQNVAAN